MIKSSSYEVIVFYDVRDCEVILAQEIIPSFMMTHLPLLTMSHLFLNVLSPHYKLSILIKYNRGVDLTGPPVQPTHVIKFLIYRLLLFLKLYLRYGC